MSASWKYTKSLFYYVLHKKIFDFGPLWCMLENESFFLRMRCHFAVAVFSKDQPNALKIACTFMMWHFLFTNQYRNQYWRINFAEKKTIKNIFHSVCIANFSNVWILTPKLAQIEPPIFIFFNIRVLAWKFKRIYLKNEGISGSKSCKKD